MAKKKTAAEELQKLAAEAGRAAKPAEGRTDADAESHGLPRGVAEQLEQREREAEKPAIGAEEVREATARLKRYQQGKRLDDENVVENEEWWRMRQWAYIRVREGVKESEPLEPASAWLLNCIMNKHADAMDSYPAATVLPREKDDVETARTLTSILPLTLEKCGYEDTYDKVWWYKLKTGVGVTGVFWNPNAENGVGEVEIRKCNVLNLFAEPRVMDIQDSEHLFYVDTMTLEQLHDAWGDKVENIDSGREVTVQEFHAMRTEEDGQRVMVIDWYYKKKNADGRTVVHLCKYVGEVVLFASENPPEDGMADMRETGWYEHGMYPFVVDVLFPKEDSWLGFGYIDVMRDPQAYIDKLDSLILRNAMMCGRKRYFMANDSGVNPEEFADWTRDIVWVEGGIDERKIKEMDVSPIDQHILTSRQNKIDELKETSGNRDFSQGGTTSGVTAASAIAALQEAGNKLSRDMIKSSYRAFRKICEMCIELYRQFYTGARSFRTTGAHGEMIFQSFDNSAIRPVQLETEFGQPAYRKAIFDITIKSMRSSPFSRISQNELAKELYGMGIFNPQMADQALMLLDMMDFEGVDALKEKISQSGTVYQQMQQQIGALQQQLAQLTGQMMAPRQAAPVMPAAEGRGGETSKAGAVPAAHDPVRQAVERRERTMPDDAERRARDIV